MVFRPAPLLTLLSLISLVILIALGVWQVQRMHERAALFATIVARADMAPLAAADITDAPELEFRAIAATTQSDAAITLFGPSARRFRAVQLADGRLLLGDVGAADGAIDGVLRRMTPDANLPPDDPAKGLYYQPGPMLARALGVPETERWYIAARTLRHANGFTQPNPRADPRASLPGPERNLGYALTWFGLAIGLVIVYLALHARMGRLKLR